MKPIHHPRLNGLTGKARQAEGQRMRREANLANGLRGDGKPRKNRRWDWGTGGGYSRKMKHRLYVRSYWTVSYALGLTARGTPRKLFRIHFPATHFTASGPMTQRAMDYRNFRATLNITRADFLTDLERSAT